MRKTLSIVLSVIMLLSLCSFAIPVSAAEGTAINTADEFLNMAAEGTYYLNSDITLSGTYINAFKGTFDGNGHTVTVSAPMFADFSGVVKNLTIKGEINYSDANAAAFAVLSTNGIHAENVVNNANVTVMGNAQYAAGFVCLDTATQTNKDNGNSTFTNCVNNGEIYLDSTFASAPTAAGFVAVVDSVAFTNCTNNAKVTTKGNLAIAAGFAGTVSPVKGTNNCEIYNSVNNGNITSDETYADSTGAASKGSSETAGFIAHVGVKKNVGSYTVYGCVNNGDVKGTYRVSGIIGYAYGSGTDQYVDIQFCINTGNLTYGRTASTETSIFDWCGPFVGYTNTKETTVKYNIDLGSYAKNDGALSMNPGMCFFGCSNADTLICDVQYNYLINKESFAYYTYASSDENAQQRHVIDECDGVLPATLDDIKSGKIAYTLNEAAKADDYGFAEGYAFYQNLGTDELPTVDSTHGVVYELNGTYTNTAVETTEAPETTAAPEVEETTAAPEVEETEAPAGEGEATEAPVADATEAPANTEPAEKKGCGGFVAGGVAIVAILGTALIAKKRD